MPRPFLLFQSSLVGFIGLFAWRAEVSTAPPDLIVYGRVWTGDSAAPWAGAVAVAGDTVVAVGDSTRMARLAGPGTRTLSSGKGMVVPGFMDGHVHFLSGGFQLTSDADRPAQQR
jgi:predicted amidohydrolase YtcJ